jgi:hypothetical protein
VLTELLSFSSGEGTLKPQRPASAARGRLLNAKIGFDSLSQNAGETLLPALGGKSQQAAPVFRLELHSRSHTIILLHHAHA